MEGYKCIYIGNISCLTDGLKMAGIVQYFSFNKFAGTTVDVLWSHIKGSSWSVKNVSACICRASKIPVYQTVYTLYK